MHGYQFFRQKPIANFIVDFFSKELKLIIEIEGHSHEGKFLKDEVRQKKLEALGFTVLRFSESQIKKNIDAVMGVIESWIKDRAVTSF